MKVRVCSDLHIDINKGKGFDFINHLNDVDINIIAGDIAGDYRTESKFLTTLNDITRTSIICVAGNHLGYDYLYSIERHLNPLMGIKEYSINWLTSEFCTGPVFYLENEYVDINDYIIYAGTMYTNFELYGNPDEYGNYAHSYMNDFRYVYTNDGETIRPVCYEDYIYWFNLFMKGLEKTIEETTKSIIVVSHFAPSIKSISEEYNGKYRELNPAYASNLDDFIKENDRIKLWVHGHMHSSFDYMIGNCRVVCEPFGYGRENGNVIEEYNGKILEI